MNNTQHKFITRATHIHNNRYDYSLIEYNHSHIKVKIICPDHGIFEQTPANHLTGKGCKQCANKSKMIPKDVFIQQSNQIHKNKYDYSLVDYINSQHKVKIICPIHGVFEQKASAHKSGQGCKKCGLLQQTETNIQRYGVKHPLQSSNLKQKQEQTCLDRYGYTNPLLSEYFKRKVIQTHIQRYGTNHSKQSHLVPILHLLNDYDWLGDQYINQNKTATQIASELGEVYYGTIINYLKKLEIPIRSYYHYSYKCIQWLESVMQSDNIHIQHALNGGEYQIPGTRYKADGYCKETNTIYEFHGDYWHGNPEIYESDIINESTQCTMGGLYQKTMEKEEKIKELGYNLVVMWENNHYI